MISFNNISSNLERLDKLYNSAITIKDKTFYSKLAIIEVCGWIEESMDKIIDCYILKRLNYKEYKKIFKDRKKKNNGFLYDNNFRKMIAECAGIDVLQTLEGRVRGNNIAVLEAQLQSLHLIRNSAAHTHSTVTSTYDSPSVIKTKFATIYPILVKFYNHLNSL